MWYICTGNIEGFPIHYSMTDPISNPTFFFFFLFHMHLYINYAGYIWYPILCYVNDSMEVD